MRTITFALMACALLGLAGAVQLSQSNVSENMFAAFMAEDLTPKAPDQVVNGTEVWLAKQPEGVADMTIALERQSGLIQVGNITKSKGRLTDGTTNYIQL